MALSARTDTRDDAMVVRLTGTIDRDAGPVLDEATAITAANAVVELDLREVEYINSSGIALFIGVLTRARAEGTTLRISGLTAHYRHIFAITRLDEYFEVVEPAGSPS